MPLDKFTQKSAEALNEAVQLANKLNHSQVTPWHLSLVLTEQPGGIVGSILQKLGKDPTQIAANCQTKLDSLPIISGSAPGLVSTSLAKVLDRAESQAGKLQDEYVSTEHLFLALLEDLEIKSAFGVDKSTALAILTDVRGSQRVTDSH